MFNDCPVSWRTSGLKFAASSTTEAEIGAIHMIIEEITHIRGMINELLGNKITEPTKIYCDNSTAVLISNNDCSPGKSRTINTKVAKIHRYILDKTIEVMWIPGDSNIADIFTNHWDRSSTPSSQTGW